MILTPTVSTLSSIFFHSLLFLPLLSIHFQHLPTPFTFLREDRRKACKIEINFTKYTMDRNENSRITVGIMLYTLDRLP